jgi:hypothetical protein
VIPITSTPQRTVPPPRRISFIIVRAIAG